MLNKTITLVAAMARNGAIGLEGRMPWHLPAELKHFKKTTLGKPVVMGRKTWESIGRALPGRQNLVVSRNKQLQLEGAQLVSSLVEAIEAAEGTEVMIIGGGELYRQALPLASRLVLTTVELEPEADTWFPAWDTSDWLLVNAENHPADEQGIAFSVAEWMRR
ncbi:MAG: dihydrofolate reductase [Xanthomonadales bacterium]|nr:dihydrofolate reductase [Xanthomonadales bacterium]